MRIVDLFSGAGGLTFGFYYKIKGNRFVRNRKNEIVFANEVSDMAARAFSLNFSDVYLIHDDIENVTIQSLEHDNIAINNIDLVIGGPPCQSYSMVGKRQYDKRAKMYKEYIRLLGILRPKMFIFENVTGLLTMKNDQQKPVINDIKEMFSDILSDGSLSYHINQQVLNAMNYGVPQSRARIFLVGIRSDFDSACWNFPAGAYGLNGRSYLTVCDAISDLPAVQEGEHITQYIVPPSNDFQRLMRGKKQHLTEHYSGIYGEKIRTVIQNIKPGEGKDEFNERVVGGIVPPQYYLTSGYHNTYGRLWWDRPSTTLTNSFSTPSALRCIHPIQDRALTTREGARIQSFPDWFEFFGNKYEKNSQIGNAVPPLLALELAKEVTKCFSRWEIDHG